MDSPCQLQPLVAVSALFGLQGGREVSLHGFFGEGLS